MEACLTLEANIVEDVAREIDNILRSAYGDELSLLLEDFAISIYEVVTWNDEVMKCDNNMFSYIHKFDSRFNIYPAITYGDICLVIPSWRIDKIHAAKIRANIQSLEEFQQGIVQTITETHQNLITKYKDSDILAEVLRLEAELPKLQKTLEYELDLILTSRKLPGTCRACPAN